MPPDRLLLGLPSVCSLSVSVGPQVFIIGYHLCYLRCGLGPGGGGACGPVRKKEAHLVDRSYTGSWRRGLKIFEMLIPPPPHTHFLSQDGCLSCYETSSQGLPVVVGWLLCVCESVLIWKMISCVFFFSRVLLSCADTLAPFCR